MGKTSWLKAGYDRIKNMFRVLMFAGKNTDYRIEIGKGNIPGSDIFISGENEAIGTTAETIRSVGGRYPFPTSAVTLSIVSDSTADDAGGIGALTGLLVGLDGSHIEQSELITFDGTTPVTTTLSYLRVNVFIVLTAGSNSTNVGNIDILNGADNLGRIQAGEGQMRQAVRTVPAGRTWFGAPFFPSGGKDDEARIEAFAFTPTNIGLMFSKTFIYQNNYIFRNSQEVPFQEKFDFEVTAVKTGAAGNARISMVVEFLEIANEDF